MLRPGSLRSIGPLPLLLSLGLGLSRTSRSDRWPGGRLIVEPGQSVGAFSLFAVVDADDAVLVIGLDIWPNGFPDDRDE